jgi:hypothetical protein
MYCPKCGTPLVIRQDADSSASSLFCEPGEIPLSLKLHEVLDHRYGEISPADLEQSPRPAPSPTFPHEWGWYCPGCGVPLNGWLECAHCGKHLRDLVYQLVERHPHLPEPNAPVHLSAQVLGLGRVLENPDQVELRVELHGAQPQPGPARLRARSGTVRLVWVIECGSDASQRPRQPRRALVVVEGMTRHEFQAGEFLEQDVGPGARELDS